MATYETTPEMDEVLSELSLKLGLNTEQILRHGVALIKALAEAKGRGNYLAEIDEQNKVIAKLVSYEEEAQMRKLEHPFRAGDTLVLSSLGCRLKQENAWLGEGPWKVSETIFLPERILHSAICIDPYCCGECNDNRTGTVPGVRIEGFGTTPFSTRNFIKASEVNHSD